jgi:glucose/arabinose dehydrogenase
MRAISILILLLAGCDANEGPPTPPPPSALRVQLVASGLSSPVHLTSPSGDTRLFVVEQAGRIRIIQNGQLLATPFLDIRSIITSGGEQGLLSLAFHPAYATNGFFYVNYTDLNGDSRTARYTVGASPNVANAASAVEIITVPHRQFGNHNGGQIAFAPDGKLLIGMGDGGGGGDPNNHGQDRTTLLGDLLRIDVDAASPYGIPADNPYAGSTQLRREIWASGLRNPWRFSIDRVSNTLYIADVGQNAWEEINAVPVTTAGVNYGWRIMEATHCYNAQTCTQTGLQNGVATDHNTWTVGDLGFVTSFGVDAAGELYILSADGRVHRIIP